MKRPFLFTRRGLILLAALGGMLVTAAMGQWQLRRAAQKQALIDMRQAQAALASIEGRSLGHSDVSPGNLEGLMYRAVQLQGQWQTRHTVYLENRQMQGRTGFYVLTPMQLETGVVVLVQRGWVPRHFSDRQALAPVDTPAGEVVLKGFLAPWPSRMYDFGAVEDGPIRQNLDFDAYRQQTGLPLLPLSVQQQGDARDGLLREWPVVSGGVEKHHAYAAQWFGLCALVALLYVWFQIVQPQRKQARP